MAPFARNQPTRLRLTGSGDLSVPSLGIYHNALRLAETNVPSVWLGGVAAVNNG